ncbi:MAG: SIMPL domain-containing protein [Eubacteriales bacterium]
MPRTITIKGTGRADIKPDFIIIRLSVGSTDKNYEKASDAASERVTALKAALTGAGFSEDALRTSDFGVDTPTKVSVTRTETTVRSSPGTTAFTG